MSIFQENLLRLFEQFSDNTKLINKFKNEYKNKNIKYSEFKPALAQAIIQELKPIQVKREKLLNNKKQIIKILNKGAKQAQKIASQNLLEIKKIIGIL